MLHLKEGKWFRAKNYLIIDLLLIVESRNKFFERKLLFRASRFKIYENKIPISYKKIKEKLQSNLFYIEAQPGFEDSG